MAPLPRIACFHGSGANSAVFEIQSSFLSSLLSDTLQLEFFDAPFPRAAGPGVLPAFEDYGPFASWFNLNTNSNHTGVGNSVDVDERGEIDGSGYDDSGRDGVERAFRLMRERSGVGKGEWVGVMGFSQGSRVAGGLLLDQQRRESQEKESGILGGAGAGEGIDLRFGVMCMGGGRPMESEIGLKIENPDTTIRIPTLHLHGLKDEFLYLGREQLQKYYDPTTAKLYEINYHHAMPWVKAESEELARLIKELYHKTKKA
ncbi:serine hydrolase FSH [Aspergillus crustosus]